MTSLPKRVSLGSMDRTYPSTTAYPDIDLHPSFPPEITDLIIDEIALFKPPQAGRLLVACSLVCRSWLIRTRYHLFRKVWLLSRRSRTFVAIVSSPLSTIVPCVRYLHLDADSYYNDGASDELRGTCEWLLTTLPAIRALSHIEHLRMTWINFAKLTKYGQPTGRIFDGFKFPNLEELFLYHCHFMTLQELAEALSHPHLKRISLNNVSVSTMGNLTAVAPSFAKLISLAITFRTSIGLTNLDILTWFAPNNGLPALERLAFSVVRVQDSPDIAKFVQTPGPSLKRLEIGFFNWPQGVTASQGIIYFIYILTEDGVDQDHFFIQRLSVAIWT